jgi:glycyl-tRNA synthetase
VNLEYLDEKTGEKFIPHIMETSVGLGRLFLMFLDKAYQEETLENGIRTVLKLDKRLTPIKIAVFPLMKNRLELVGKAREIFDKLKMKWMCEFDDNGNVGKRYRRQDEIGTPFCVTVDFDTLETGIVTVRDRDTMQQEKVAVENLEQYLAERLN